jgi:hypothetical protein
MTTEYLASQMPRPGLDGISRADLEREWRGAIFIAKLRVQTLEKMERLDVRAIKAARNNLAALIRDARAERIKPFSRG